MDVQRTSYGCSNDEIFALWMFEDEFCTLWMFKRRDFYVMDGFSKDNFRMLLN